MKVYNEEFIQKVFDIVDWDYIAVDINGYLFSYKDAPKVRSYTWQSERGGDFICKIDLNGMHCKDTLRVRKWVPKNGEIVYISDPLSRSFYHDFRYYLGKVDSVIYERSLIFRTREEAISCAQEMVEAVKKG